MKGNRFGRRRVLRIGASAAFGSLVARYLYPVSAFAEGPPPKARSCILLWQNGGPSHVDTFDPKPGPLKAIKTRAPAMMLSELLPRLADRANRLAVVRNLSSKEGNHTRAQYYVHTGYAPNPTVEHPSIGAWVSARRSDATAADLPAFVSIGGPSFGAGFLGVQNGPFVVAKAGTAPSDVGLPPGVDVARFDRRRAALDVQEDRFARSTADVKIEARRGVYAKAARLMQAPGLEAFDLTGESDSVRKAYGDTDFGRGCLVARRLVERGVKFVEVVLDGWDTHQNNFARNRALCGTLDPAFASLLDDLAEKHLLDSTLVACMGEFGRTPHVNANDGRDHWPHAWSAVFAGGGIRGGIVHGATDAVGANVVGTPTTVPDLLATMATLLGLDPSHTETSAAGRPISVTDGGTPIRGLLL